MMVDRSKVNEDEILWNRYLESRINLLVAYHKLCKEDICSTSCSDCKISERKEELKEELNGR